MWHELVLCGIGGRTIAEAQQRLSYTEFFAWVRYRRKQSRARLIDGLSALHHGRWLAGEKLLLSAAGEAEVGPVALSAALRAADKRGDEAAAQRHLQRLQEIDPLRHALLQARRLLL